MTNYFQRAYAAWRILWLCLLLLAPASLVLAQGAPFSCDVVFFQVRNAGGQSQIVRFSAVNSTVTPTGVYSALQPTLLNALGYNPVDNYMYGIQSGGQIPQLYRVGQSGYQLVGTVTNSLVGGTALSASFNPTGGVFDAAGRFYFVGQGAGIVPAAILRVDSIPTSGTSQVAHQYNLNPPAVANFGDFDFNGAGSPDGLLLAATGANLFRITLQQNSSNPALGTATVQTVALTAGPNGNNVGGVGSAFYDAFTSRFFVFDNNNNDFWQIVNPQFGTPSPLLTDAALYQGPPTFPGPYTPTDGTSCPLSGARVADLGITKTDNQSSVPVGAVTSYTITATNAGPYPGNYAVVRDPAAPGLRKLSVTCSAPGGPPSAICPPTLSTSTFEVGVQVQTFPVGTTLVFTVNAQVTATAGSTVINTATIAPANDTTDPNLTNNTAVDSNTVFGTNASVVTAASICPAGSLEITTNLLANGNFAAPTPLVSDAAVGALNTYNVANSVARQTGTQAYLGAPTGILQNAFPGDASRSVPGGESWLLSNGKTGAANYRVVTQAVTGLTVGRTYEFMAYVSNATRPGTSSPTLPNLGLLVGTGAGNSTLTTISPVNEGGSGDIWTLVQGSFSATATAATLTVANLAAASAEPGGGDVAGIAQLTLRACAPAADVSVSKNNGTNTLVSTGTTAYTITVSNLSAANATDTLIVDPFATNLVKTSVTCVTSGANLCPTTLTVAGLENPGLTIPRVVPGGGTVVFVVFANVTGPPGETATNVVTINGVGYTDADPSNNAAQDSDPIRGVANLSITKSNGGTTITTGSTTSYTVTVANAGPAVVTNAVLLDPSAFGLSCTAVTCTGVIGAATCPSAASVTIGALQVGGITLPSMGVPSSIIFRVDCTVTATGQ